MGPQTKSCLIQPQAPSPRAIIVNSKLAAAAAVASAGPDTRPCIIQ